MDLTEIAVNTRNWVDSAQDTDYRSVLVNAALKHRVPYAMELVSYTVFHNPVVECRGATVTRLKLWIRVYFTL